MHHSRVKEALRADCALAAYKRCLQRLACAVSELSKAYDSKRPTYTFFYRDLAAAIEACECAKNILGMTCVIPSMLVDFDEVRQSLIEIQDTKINKQKNLLDVREALKSALGACNAAYNRYDHELERLSDKLQSISHTAPAVDSSKEAEAAEKILFCAPRESHYRSLYQRIIVPLAERRKSESVDVFEDGTSVTKIDLVKSAIDTRSIVVCDVSEFDICVYIALGVAMSQSSMPPIAMHDEHFRQLPIETTQVKEVKYAENHPEDAINLILRIIG